MRNVLKFLTLGVLFLSPSFVFANVSFSEIMYDLKTGGDTDREWVEIFNGDPSSVDISDWRFFEGDTNHKIVSPSSGGVLLSNEYAIIASDEAKFKIDNPSYIGKIFQSSFSLSNTGESLALRTSALANIDIVSYSSAMGANGDGNSLQNINGTWKAAVPTPGKENGIILENSSQNTGTQTETQTQNDTNQSSVSGQTTYTPPESVHFSPIVSWITAYAGEAQTVVVGSRVVLNGNVRGTNGEDLPFATYSWNTGDGDVAEGKTIEHRYYYPGEYIAELTVVNGMYTAQARVIIAVVPVDVVISKVGTEDAFVEIKNNTKNEVDMSGWTLRHAGVSFVFPKGMFIRAGKSITVPSRITKFIVVNTPTYLLYPDGTEVSSFGRENAVATATSRTQTNSSGIAGAFSQKVVVSAQSITENKKQKKTQMNEDGGQVIVPAAQTASIGNVPLEKTNDHGLFWGLVGVALVILIAIYMVLESPEKSFSVAEKAKNEAEKYTILDIES